MNLANLRRVYDVLVENRDIITLKFGMSEYARFDNGTKTGSLYMSNSEFINQEVKCGCLLGWSCMLLGNNSNFIEEISKYRYCIYFYKWTLDFLEYEESSEEDRPIYDYLFSSIWEQYASTNTLDFGLERIKRVLDGYDPKDLKIELEEACKRFGEVFDSEKYFNIISI